MNLLVKHCEVGRMFNEKYAVVIGGAHFNSLGIIRALGEEGIKSVFINIDDWSFSEKSRYTLETVHVNAEKDVVSAIIKIVEKYGGSPALYPTTDYSAALLDENYDMLKSITYCPNCEGKLDYYIRKENMCEAAREAGFIVPETKMLNVDDSFKEELLKFPKPFILKPVNNMNGSKSDIRICRNNDEIDGIINDFRGYKIVLIQQYVHGKENLTIGYSGCKTKGRKVEVYGQIEKIREYPVDRGSTSYAVIKKEITYMDTEVLDRFLEITGYSGVFDLDLKVVDGVPYFIEINFRNGATAYAFIKGRFNLHSLWFRQQCGEKTEPVNFKETRFICEGLDLSHVVERRISIFTWLKDYITADAHMIANKKDIKPFIFQYKILKPFFEAKFSKQG